MNKYVNETKAAKSLSAWVILKRHREVATVRAYFSDGGTCLVNVFNYGEKNKSSKDLGFQYATASGYGYDKLTAALAGLIIDGHKLGNHCQYSKKAPEGGLWPHDSVAPRGWHFANFCYQERKERINPETQEREFYSVELPKEKQGWSDCYRESGLDYLRKIGYTVIQAI